LLNAAAVLAALECLQERLPVSMGAIRQGLITVELPGRFQVLPGRPAVVLDVAHNPQAAAVLADNLSNMGYFPETWAIVGMLGDKDIEGTLKHLAGRVDHWLPCDLEGPRAARGDDLAAILSHLGLEGELPRFASPEAAWAYALGRAGENDRIVAFGSFLTVSGVMKALAGG
jgi:dihydrofolate synthase/folylpolyglutamate synthase